MRLSMIGLGALLVLGGNQRAIAQITPETPNSLNTTILSPDGRNFVILNGSTAGSNLFHGFATFSVPSTGSATFNLGSTPNVTAIFSRVTGGTASNIEGVVQAVRSDGIPVSLFLFNPSGIVFGPNARLNLGGSLVASTASGIKFQDGSTFGVGTPPVLTMSVPIGLQMGAAPNGIIVQGTGHTLAPASPADQAAVSPLIQPTRPGMQLRPGNTLALIGGDISLSDGVLGAAMGRIELGAIAEGMVSIVPFGQAWQFGYEGVTSFRDVTLSGRSLLDVGGINAGSMQLQGRNIRVQGTSLLFSQNAGPLAGGAIALRASEQLLLQGATNRLRGGILSETVSTGASSPIAISAPRILLQTGSGISAKTFQSARSGDIQIETQDLQIEGYSPTNELLMSQLGTVSLGSGSSGDTVVNAQRVKLSQGGSMGTTTLFGSGASGQITVNADTVEVQGGTPSGIVSSLSSTSFGAGAAGRLMLTTRRLMLMRGGAVAATAYAQGDAGDVIIKSTESIDALGRFSPLTGGSTINSSILRLSPAIVQRLGLSLAPPTGNAGLVQITTPRLTITEGASMSVRNNGNGRGGELQIKADQVFLNSTGRISAETLGSGAAGSLILEAHDIDLQTGASLSSTAYRSGQAGAISLKSDRLSLASGAYITSETKLDGKAGQVVIEARDRVSLSGSVISTSTENGQGGQLQLLTPLLQLQQQSRIESTTFGTGTGGMLQGRIQTLQLRDEGKILAETRGSGAAGVIDLQIDQAELHSRSKISTSSLGSGNAGELKLQARSLMLSDWAEISSAALGSGTAGNLSIQAEGVSLRQNAQISSRSDGTGAGGTVTLTARSLRLNQSKLDAQTKSGNGGNLRLQLTELLHLNDGALLSADAAGSGDGGNIAIAAPFVIGWNDSDIVANAVDGDGGKIEITTQGIFGLQFRDRLTPDNDITASSKTGVNGTVQINLVGIDVNSGLVQLATDLVSNRQLAKGCSADRGSSFVATGRGGIAPEPSQIRRDRPWSDLRPLMAAPRLVEATQWQRISGKVHLIAAQSVHTPSIPCDR